MEYISLFKDTGRFKPNYGIRIDRSQDLSKGLISAYLFRPEYVGTSKLRNYVSHTAPKMDVSNILFKTSKSGLGLKLVDATSFVKSNVKLANKGSIVIGFKATLPSAGYSPLFHFSDGIIKHFQVGIGSDGSLRAHINDTLLGDVYADIVAGTLINGKSYQVTLVWDRVSYFKVYADLLESSAQDIASPESTSLGIFVGEASDLFVETSKCVFDYLYIYEKILKKHDISILKESPFIIFDSVQKRLFAVGTIIANMVSYGGVVASGTSSFKEIVELDSKGGLVVGSRPTTGLVVSGIGNISYTMVFNSYGGMVADGDETMFEFYPFWYNLRYNTSPINFTVDVDLDIINITGEYEFILGDRVAFRSTGVLPKPLEDSKHYYVIPLSLSEVRVATTRQNAYDGVYVDITSQSSLGSINDILVYEERAASVAYYMPKKLITYSLYKELVLDIQHMIDRNEIDSGFIVNKYKDIFTESNVEQIAREFGYGYIVDMLQTLGIDLSAVTAYLGVIHYLKGHKVGLELVLKLYNFLSYKITEWWEETPRFEPCSFKLTVWVLQSQFGKSEMSFLLAQFIQNYVFPKLVEFLIETDVFDINTMWAASGGFIDQIIEGSVEVDIDGPKPQVYEAVYVPNISYDNGYTWPHGFKIIDYTYDTMYVGYRFPPNPQNLYVRFCNVDIPSGANIISAEITFTNIGVESVSLDGFSTLIYGVLHHDPENPETVDEYDALPLTNTVVTWMDVSSHQIYEKYNTPDLKTIVGEIIEQPQWESGNHLMILIKAHNTPTNVYISPWGGAFVNCPKLTIRYTLEGGGGGGPL